MAVFCLAVSLRRLARLGVLILAIGATLAPPGSAQGRALSQTPDPTTLTVTSAADPGDGVCDATCTLRDAVNAANADPAANRIVFAVGSGPVRIRLTAPLPALDDPGTTIDGGTQPGYQGIPLVYLDGAGLLDASGFVSRAPGIEFRASPSVASTASASWPLAKRRTTTVSWATGRVSPRTVRAPRQTASAASPSSPARTTP